MMYQIGDELIYGIHGVCRVVNLEEQTVDKTKRTFLALEPLGQPGTKYLVPTHNAAAMAKLSPILSPQALTSLLQSREIRRDCWIPDENQRKQYYRTLVGSGDRIALLTMLYVLYRHKKNQAALGRRLHVCDENFLRDAEKTLSGEISAVLSLDPGPARDYLRRELQAE